VVRRQAGLLHRYPTRRASVVFTVGEKSSRRFGMTAIL
jgi:hypothetical protein